MKKFIALFLLSSFSALACRQPVCTSRTVCDQHEKHPQCHQQYSCSGGTCGAKALDLNLSLEVSGACDLTSAEGKIVTHAFKIGPNSMVKVGAFGLKVEVVNNIGNELAASYAAAGFSVDFDEDNRFHNPPVLCPETPEEGRVRCEEENRRNDPPYEYASQTKFTPVIPNPGFLDTRYIGRDLEHLKATMLAISLDQLKDGFAAEDTYVLGGVSVHCSLKFRE